MNKIYLYIILFFAIVNTSCTDFLDTSSKSEYTADLVFSTPSYTKSAIMGIYSITTSDELYSSRLSTMFAYNSDIEVAGADRNSFNEVGNRGLSNYFATPSFSGHLERVWGKLYQGIERANVAISEIAKSPAVAPGSKTKQQMMGYYGEALALRALYYFELVRHWGDVPFKTEPTNPDGSNFYLPATNRDTIMAHIINDLIEAEKHVPWVNSGEYTAERITKGFIMGLTARIALVRGGYSIRNITGFPTLRPDDWMEYYTLANTKLKELVNDPLNPHKLNPSYLDNFIKLNRWELETNYNECMFQVAMGYNRSGEIGYSVGVRFRTNKKYGYNNNSNVVSTTPYYFYMFDRKDIRRDISVCYYNYSNSSGDLKEVFTTNPFAWCIGKYDMRWMTERFIADNINANGKRGYGINWVPMRYADVLLMLAETENALNNGPTDLAKNCLKDVRRRAFDEASQVAMVNQYVDNLTDFTSFFNALVNERAYEFGGEGIRKYDLIRWNLLSSKIEEQRVKFKQIINGEGEYSFMPRYLFVKYIDGEIIDKEDINFFEDKGDQDIAGYERITWLPAGGAATKSQQFETIDKFSSGLNSVVPNRHLYPYQNTIINESGGLLTNSYNF